MKKEYTIVIWGTNTKYGQYAVMLQNPYNHQWHNLGFFPSKEEAEAEVKRLEEKDKKEDK